MITPENNLNTMDKITEENDNNHHMQIIDNFQVDQHFDALHVR